MKDVSEQLIEDRIRELWEKTDFVSTLFENLVGYAIIAADFDGNIIAYNEGARQIYGYAPEEIIGKQNIEIFFPKDFIETGKLQHIIADLIEKGRFSYEGEKVRKNGERFAAQIRFALSRDKNGRVVGFIEIMEDITERKRMQEKEMKLAAAAERVEQLEREIRSLGRLSGSPQTAVTAQTFGLAPLRESMPDIFSEQVQHYKDLMDLVLEQRAYKVEHSILERLRSMGEQIGFLKAGPRDVVEIHTTALKEKIKGAASQKVQAYIEEGRLMVLELMGYLVSYYRT